MISFSCQQQQQQRLGDCKENTYAHTKYAQLTKTNQESKTSNTNGIVFFPFSFRKKKTNTNGR